MNSRSKSTLPVIGIAAWRQDVEVWGSRMNIFQIDEAYVDRIHAAEAIPMMLPHVRPGTEENVVSKIDALLLTGGDDIDPACYGDSDKGTCRNVDPDADRREIALLNAAVERGIPVLGTCRGMQLINVAFGGTLNQKITQEGRADHGPRPTLLDDILALRHPVEIVPGSRLASILGCGTRLVNTTHHQGLARLAQGFKVVARAPDGTVEAIEAEDPGKYIIGVQWHPEKLPAMDNQELFDDLASAAKCCNTA